jgi:hypothetical protein
MNSEKLFMGKWAIEKLRITVRLSSITIAVRHAHKFEQIRDGMRPIRFKATAS